MYLRKYELKNSIYILRKWLNNKSVFNTQSFKPSLEAAK